MIKLCQGPRCHIYDTTDRKRGPKGNKRNQSRTVGTYGYGNENFCTLSCYNDWSKEHMDRAIDYIGRIHKPRVLTEQNGWTKQQRYSWSDDFNTLGQYYYHNMITKERRPLTEQQFNDSNYTLNT